MISFTDKPGVVLASGLAVAVLTSLAPAGLRGAPVPAAAYGIWGAAFLASVALMRGSGAGSGRALLRILWLAPPILVLSLTASLLAPPGRRLAVAAALILRSLASSSVALATATVLGPAGIVLGLRALRVPALLVDVVHGMLVGLAAIARQVAGMQRARIARRARSTPLSALVSSPVETVRGFGRIAGALFLRSMERAEALERARRARGGGEE